MEDRYFFDKRVMKKLFKKYGLMALGIFPIICVANYFLNKVLDFFKKCFYGRWYYEALEYFNDGDIQGEYLICLEDDKVVGFLRLNKNKIKKISYNENWNKRFDTLVGVGPLGVDPDYRKNGIAKALIFKGLIDSHNEGIKNAMIDWTGLMAIYQKYGFEVWKCYQYASKDF